MNLWTNEQQQAIDARNSNLLVSAAAGSGKTAVLVERIIQMIVKDKINIDSLLIVTFTNAAAGEMRERIAAAIEKQLMEKNEAHLRKQLNLLNRAAISTIHSFCIDVVSNYFHLIDIDPNFRIADEIETNLIKLEILEELLENEYELGDKYFIGLVERFGGSKDDTPLQELILKLYQFIQSKPYPLQWLADIVESFKVNVNQFNESSWYQTLMQLIAIELDGAKEVFKEALELCDTANGPIEYAEAILADIQMVDSLKTILNKDITEFFGYIHNLQHQRLGRVGKKADEILKEEVKDLREQGKNIIKGIKENILVKSPEVYLTDLNELYPYMIYLLKLVTAFDNIYHEKKIERGIVDFNDLEHYALTILSNEQAALEYRNKFNYIFIDEYQDSNIVQETIISLIKKGNNLFMVGDVKQSIYRFRLADPSLFIEKYHTFSNKLNDINLRIDLSKNFRSREEIIDGVNFIFKHLMTEQLGEIDYNENAFLYKGAEYQTLKDSVIELNLIEKENSNLEEIEEEIEELATMEMEVKIITKQIKDLLETEIYDAKQQQFRKVTYRDIVVLLRTTKEWAQTFLETFISEGIPAYADVNTGFFATIEVNIFLNLLKIIDNKRQDVPLLSVMRSVIGSFSIEELIEIRIKSSARTYIEAIEKYIQKEDDLLKLKLVKFFAKLNNWQEESRYMNLEDFIWKLLMDTGYYYYVQAMPGGVQRQANLRILVDRAQQFQKTSIRGLFNFIKFIDRLKESSGDMGTARTLSENENVIRIMSIHKSKGLEFPIVFVAGMGKKFNLRDVNEPILFHKDLGLGPKYVDPEIRQTSDTIARIVMKQKIKLESLSEEMRILYVAFTRAKDKLILTGTIKSINDSIKKWKQNISIYNLAKGKNYLDWLLPLIFRHRDGSNLRELAGISWDESRLLIDDSKWVVNLWNKTDIQRENLVRNSSLNELKKQLQNFALNTKTTVSDIINEKLNWQYKNLIATKIPAKLTVTEITRNSQNLLDTKGINIPTLVKTPKFIEGKGQFTGAEKGVIIHFVMQHIDLHRVGSNSEIELQLKEMVAKELLLPEEAKIIDIEKLVLFFNSNIGKRILNAEKVYREVPFNLVKGDNEKILIQGVIDCYFPEAEGYILVDYKTDYINPNKQQDIINNYRKQIALYKEALESITGKKVDESYLYLFDINQEVRLY